MKKNNNIFKQARGLLMLLFLLLNIVVNAQNNINRVEYFFDTDPGFGSATSIPITANADITDQIHSIDISAISNGFHNLFIRSRDDSGNWSLSISSIVFRANFGASSNAQIVKAEYFFDTDPGFGNAIPISLTANNNIADVALSIDISIITTGFHSFFIRTQDQNGTWSLTNVQSIFKTGSNSSVPNLTTAEYFFDTDPGFGNGQQLALSPSANIADQILVIDLSSISVGFHSFNIRTKDVNGAWSLTNVQPIFKTGNNTNAPNLVKAEYFFDTDPGFDNATSITFAPTNNLADEVRAVDLTNVSNGFHSFNFRTKDANGSWSLTNRATMFKFGTAASLNITKAEFFIDDDPGFGNATNISITAATNISDYVATVVNPHTLAAGVHNFFIRTQDANGVWSLTNSISYTVYPNSQFENVTITGCGSVTYNSTEYTANANVVDTFKAIYGYDSVIRTANIIVNPKYNFTQTINLNGCTSVMYNSVAYNSSTSFIDTVKTTKGCDSVYKTINITVYNVFTITNNETLIGCGSYTFNSTNYTSNSVVRDTIKTENGCDSIYNIHNIIIITPTTQNSNLLGCGSVTYNSNVYNSSTVVHDTLRSITGCDSVYKIVTITVINPFTLNYSLSGCNSVNYNGNNYTSSTIVYDTVKSSLGCDSVYNVVTINVTTVTPVNQVVNISGCNSATYESITYTNSTTLNQTIYSYQGCDSVYKTVKIAVYHLTPTTNTTNVSGCNSVVYNSNTYTSSTTLRDTVRSVASNCDSIYNVVNINVTTVNAVSQTINVAGCDSATYNSVKYFASTTLHDTLLSYQGCDSVYKTININVVVKPTINVTASVNPVCSTNPTILTATGGSNYTWSPSTALSNTTGTSVTASPFSTITYTVTSNNVCIVSKQIVVNVNPLPNVNAGANQSILLGSSTTLTATGATSYTWNTGNAADTTASIIVAPTSNTNYTVTGVGANGCTAQDLVSVAVNFSSLAVNTNNFNFGNVVVNTTSSTNIIVTNNGTLPITLNSVTTSSPYTSSIAAQSIAANTSISIPVSFNPTATLFYVNSLTINTSIGNFVVTLQGRGVAAAPSWIINPSTRSFANTLVNDSSTQMFTVFNTGNIPVNVSSITSSNAVFTGISSNYTIAIGGNATITVKYKPTTIGVNSATISINSTTPNLATVTATVTGSGYVNNIPPTLHFVSSTPYNSSNGVNPILGQAGTYTYRILYKSSTNTAPQVGYPKVGIDKNGDGDYIDNDEGVFTMNQLNTTSNWVAGEEFTFSTNLAIGNLYGYRFFANDSLGNPAIATNTDHNYGPNVTDQTLDLSIFANDISFSVAHPNVGQTFTVFATVHNNTPYNASNVNIRFYTDSVYYNQTTLPFIGANSSEVVSMNFVYNSDGFYPIKVWIDSANNLGETNALNNYAIRPIVVGNFTVPGAIIVNANASPQNCPDGVVFSGTAHYAGLNLAGTPPVLGALVTVKENGVTIATTYTITEGYWSVYITQSCGTHTYTVEVTDFTLTGTVAKQSYTIACGVNCGGGSSSSPDYTPPFIAQYTAPVPCCIIPNQPFTHSFGITNDDKYTLYNDSIIVYADDTLKAVHHTDSIAKNQSFNISTSFNFNSGNHTIKYYTYTHHSYLTVSIDTTGGLSISITTHHIRMVDSSIVNIYIDTPKADLTLSEFVQTNARSISIKVGNATCINAGISKLYVYETNANYDSASKVLLDSVATTAILAGKCADTRVLLNYTKANWTQGYHYIILQADGGNAVDEKTENNNELRTTIYVPQPELNVSNIQISNSNVNSGDNVNFVAAVNNTGGASATNFKVQFYVNNVAFGTKQTISSVGANSSTVITSAIYTMPNHNCNLNIKVVVDVDNDIVEQYENNNIDSIKFGSDVDATLSCNYLGSSCNPYVVYVGTSLTMNREIKNLGLRDVDATQVDFSINGSSIGSDNITHINAKGFANSSVSHTFNTVGNYVVDVNADYANDYCEEDEANNLGYIYVTVTSAVPDLQVLSHFISPSNLNPNPGQNISVVSSVKNIGTLVSQPSFVRFWVDNVQLGNDVPLNAIKVGRDTTVAATANYTGASVGPKIIKVTVHYGEATGFEQTFTNNEATRSIICGAAPDFARTIKEGISFNRSKYRIGKAITIRNYIRNYGGESGTAWLKFYYRDTLGGKTLIDSAFFSINHHDSARVTKRWTVAGYGRIITEIVGANPQEFNVLNNVDSIDLAIDTTTPNVIVTPNLSNVCEGTSITFTASATHIIAPIYVWKFNGVLTGDTAATYSHIMNVGDAVSCDVYDEEQYLLTSSNTYPTLRLKTYSTTNVTRCSNQLPLNWNSTNYNTSGTYTKTLVNSVGCDSIATLVFTVLQATSSTTRDSILIGNSYLFNGNSYTTSGTYTIHFTNAKGCDSTAILILTVKSAANGAAITGNLKSCSLNTINWLSCSASGGIWKSSDTTIAKVANSGGVTGLSNGSTNITYTYKIGSITYVSSVVYTVAVVNTPQNIAGLNNVCVGSTIQLTNATPGGVWSSLNNRASIDANTGLLTGLNGGEYAAVIRYTVTNNLGCSAYVNRNVIVNALPGVPTISYAPGTIGNPQTGAPKGAFCVGKTFGVVGTPNAPGVGTWNGAGIASITSAGIVTITATGTGSIKYTYTNTDGCSNSRTMTGNGFTCAARGISINNEQQSVNSEFVMYPNPARTVVNVLVDRLIGDGEIIVTDIYGKTVKKQALSIGTNTIDIANLNKGFYLVSIINSDGKVTKKLVIE